jgi:hypothetical protein
MSHGITLNETANDEHVGEIERFIHTRKECMRAIYNMILFNHMPPQIIIEMAKHSVFSLNSFPHPNGVSAELSPRTIITRQGVNFNPHCKYEFGEYIQTHEQHDKAQGNYYFFSLSTGRIINCMHAKKTAYA